ncbi:MAG: hypothetical protein B7Y36_05735 [Novosphingobium sp. 28-62-57]|uniref:glycine zipper 2TM domain-containing protein n=1 Tax=unclassified Novosphingobium TaxID=2644732 RepID=UPI000BD4C5A5|nr:MULTISPECIES: glycine zipper 2TM domain-containing protein [unclassified Novosphingobium]OYW50252.1 MAG: hypothetical protein B7Z34_05180 [Novosphingobium sp. 12-62-10]OYZ11643.1 MAG: hypothetical protein B7Y36_05735 [Novosphingobium sp. 28-62-57]OZA36984.1 MAG: hypothetical protein B7X92_05270 [Novosphingobium sp. 17-62-9]HQS68817.1 glycine zipper 2TM domain-containing protein [Novosphingobium sp.]
MLARLTIAALILGATASPALANQARVPAGVSYGAGPMPGPVYYPPMAGPPYPTVVMTQPVNGAMQQPVYPQGYPQGYPQNAQAYPPVAQGGYPGPDPRAVDPRWAEMNERCTKVYGDRHVGGTVLGGVAGGVIGNRVAGSGNRVLGTVIGGVAGAVAGNLIDKGEDKNLRRECDDYFASLPPQGAAGYYPGAYPGYPPAPYGYMWVPVVSGPQKPCVETTVVTEKWVSVPARRRVIHKRTRIVPDKRVKEKRVYTG